MSDAFLQVKCQGLETVGITPLWDYSCVGIANVKYKHYDTLVFLICKHISATEFILLRTNK